MAVEATPDWLKVPDGDIPPIDPNVVTPPIESVPPVADPVPPIETPPVTPPEGEETVSVTLPDGTAKEFKLDAAGNAIDETGTIVYTKEQLVDSDEGDLDIKSIIEDTGVVPFDERGEPMELPSTIDGVKVYTRKVAEQEYYRGGKEALDRFMNANPDVQDMIKYKRIYGTLDGYNNTQDYTKLVVDETSEEQWIDLIAQARKLKGDSDAEITKYIRYSKADGTLKVDAEAALEHLSSVQKKNENVELSRRKAEAQQRVAQEEAYFGVRVVDNRLVPLQAEGSIYDLVVNKGEVAGLSIPKTGIIYKKADGSKVALTRMDIFEYIHRPVQEVKGVWYSQAELDEAEVTKDPSAVVLRYIQNAFGEDVNQFVKRAQENAAAKEIRRMKIKGSGGSTGGNKTTSGRIVFPIG
jgi:hypothetical protein